MEDATFELIVSRDPLSQLGTDADLAIAFGPILPEGPWKTTRLTMDEHLVAASRSMGRPRPWMTSRGTA